MSPLPTLRDVGRADDSSFPFHIEDEQSDLHLLTVTSQLFFNHQPIYLSSSFRLHFIHLFWRRFRRSRASQLNFILTKHLIPSQRHCLSVPAMFKFPLQIARRRVRHPVSFLRRCLTSSSVSDRAMYVNQAVNELQTAQGTTSTGRLVNRICTRLANDRATTRTEQLIWLAKHALETSTARESRSNRDNEQKSHEAFASQDNRTTSSEPTKSDSAGRQS
ncbi:hypothetical protein BDW02DRAFT_570891 [Decorospora gaudefroyi]|uniref:Uncharacterized protein n=1 Tax=Decorospora gaudefroyi TaxID=184978 RepID=A0A6A5KDS9_9PLEO|nr:hypothetical protein BDW02DRAFT_570891 [Decorospora gaudefroyi]